MIGVKQQKLFRAAGQLNNQILPKPAVATLHHEYRKWNGQLLYVAHGRLGRGQTAQQQTGKAKGRGKDQAGRTGLRTEIRAADWVEEGIKEAFRDGIGLICGT